MLKQKKSMISLCDKSGVACEPWARAGYGCYAVDIRHERDDCVAVGEGLIHFIKADITDFLPPNADYVFGCAFPPCTNLAVSGARWVQEKGVGGLETAIRLVRTCERIMKWTDAPYFIENPVSTLSTYWRKPDHIFHPWEYAGLRSDDHYTKKTCLWTGAGFRMPEARPLATNALPD